MRSICSEHCKHSICALPNAICCLSALVLRLHGFADSASRQSLAHRVGVEDGDVEIKVLRYSVRVVAPGCMALVLESLTSRAPYVLENRTPHPLYFRQAATLPYQELPPYAAAGFCWRLVSGQPQKVGLSTLTLCRIGPPASQQDMQELWFQSVLRPARSSGALLDLRFALSAPMFCMPRLDYVSQPHKRF